MVPMTTDTTAPAGTTRKRRVPTLEQLTAIGAEMRELDARKAELLAQRKKLTLRARKEGATWQSLATLLGLTQNGIIKATLDK